MSIGQQFDRLGNISYAYDGSIAVDVGDLIYHDTNDAKPASSQSDAGTELKNQRLFASKFAGVAVEAKTTGSAAGTLLVSPVWIGYMTCASSTFEVDDLVAIDEASSGTALEDSVLVKTTDQLAAIGRVLERYASATTSVKVMLVAKTLGGIDAWRKAAVQHTTVAASDTLVTGLNTVVAVVAVLDSDPVDGCQFVSASIGDQAGTPAAGSVLINTWKATGGTTAPTALIAATTFTKKVNVLAFGT